MSSSIWTRCAGKTSLAPYRGVAWRMVESQQRASTRKLCDTQAEHELLERMLDDSKPALPRSAPAGRALHWLLTTPFRYPPLIYGSRFGRRHERGIWYGSEERATTLAAVAFYRLWFLQDTDAELGPLATEHTAFKVRLATDRAVDLCAKPFLRVQDPIASPSEFGPTQQLGTDMREAGVVAFRFRSARCRAGTNVGVFDPAAFSGGPFGEQQWHCYATRDAVELTRVLEREQHTFLRELFAVSDKLAPRPS